MPNWVYNRIAVKVGSEDKAEKLIREFFNEEGDFDFEKIIPSPKTMEECPIRYITKGNEHIQELEDRPWFNWYDWQINHWGVKWNAGDSFHMYDSANKKLYISFETPWSWPAPIFNKLIEKFPHQIQIKSYTEWDELCYKHNFCD